jgi:predicted HTH domain antitoxin
MSNFIIVVQELYESSVSIQEISEYLNVSLELIEDVVKKYLEND